MTQKPDYNLGLSTRPMAIETDAAMRLARGGEGTTPLVSLLFYHRDGARVLTIDEGQTLIVGREPGCDVALPDEGLSRRHARFSAQHGEVWVEDLQSTNGTRLNGQRLRSPARLRHGDEVTMGAVAASMHTLAPVDSRLHGLDSHDDFYQRLREEVERARYLGRSLGVLMLAPMTAEAGALPASLLPQARAALRPIDRCARYSDRVLEVLAPELPTEQVRDLAAALLASASAADSELVCGIATLPESGASGEQLLDAARAALRNASPQQRVQFHPAAGPRRVDRRKQPSTVEQQSPVIVSVAMQQLYETVERLAQSLIPVLLIGETGAGKEVIATALHERGPRRDHRLSVINCGAIPQTLIESVLFGHEKGAFTGATQQQKGLFEDSDGGTVLLDEIGELSPAAQAALLRVLETKRLTRVGSNRPIDVDVRVIAATHRDLEAMCAEGRFRWDLLYRLNAMTLRIPPLRERPEEIAPLAERFIREASRENGCIVSGIDAEAMRLLITYPWPGNIRELRNAIERAVVIARGERVTPADLPDRVRGDPAQSEPAASATHPTSGAAPANPAATGPIEPPAADATTAPPAASGSAPTIDDDPADFKTRVQRFEAELLLDALRRCNGSRSEAAALLQMPVRTLSHKIRQHGIRRLGYDRQE